LNGCVDLSASNLEKLFVEKYNIEVYNIGQMIKYGGTPKWKP